MDFKIVYEILLSIMKRIHLVINENVKVYYHLTSVITLFCLGQLYSKSEHYDFLSGIFNCTILTRKLSERKSKRGGRG